jgi:hypothetical protein
MAAEQDNVNAGAIATMAIVGALAMAGVTWAVTAVVRGEVDAASNAVGAHAAERPVRDMVATQTSELTQPAGWADKSKGTVKLPIDRAKQVLLEDLARDPNAATAPGPVDAGAVGADAAGGSMDASATTDGAAAAADGAAAEAGADSLGNAPDKGDAGVKKKKKPVLGGSPVVPPTAPPPVPAPAPAP